MMMAKALATAIIFTIAAPVVAQDTAPVPGALPAPADKKVCRSEQVTGSIMPKRTCHTKSEWVGIDQANADAVQNMRNQRGSGH